MKKNEIRKMGSGRAPQKSIFICALIRPNLFWGFVKWGTTVNQTNFCKQTAEQL